MDRTLRFIHLITLQKSSRFDHWNNQRSIRETKFIAMAHKNLLNYFSHQVNLYFDNRLNEDSTHELLEVVNMDPECKTLFNREKNFREFVKNNIKRPPASPELISTIKNKLA